MATFQKFNSFVQDIGRKVHNLNSDVLKVMLTNTAPVATNSVKADLVEIAAVNGYVAGGLTPVNSGYSQAAGVGKLTLLDVVFTAAGGAIGPFRYAVLYNHTAVGDPLIGFFDYSTSISIQDLESFTIQWDAVNGVLTLT